MKEGVLAWCDENGNYFSDDKLLKRAKHAGNAYLRISENYSPAAITGLPTPYELTGDAEWQEGGKLLKQYNLELDKRADLGQEPGGAVGVVRVVQQ